jgi:hypothetical protein
MLEASIFSSLLGFLGAIVGGVFTVLIGPWIAEKFKLRGEYFVPFKKWCTVFYGDVYEFGPRYLITDDYNQFSDIQIIIDYRSLHNSLIDSTQWIGKIQNDDPETSESLHRLLETVDKFYHKLENTYPLDLPSVDGVKDFNSKIKLLSERRRTEIADEIRSHLILSKCKGEYKKDDFNKIFSYLTKRIPNDRIKIRKGTNYKIK